MATVIIRLGILGYSQFFTLQSSKLLVAQYIMEAESAVLIIGVGYIVLKPFMVSVDPIPLVCTILNPFIFGSYIIHSFDILYHRLYI